MSHIHKEVYGKGQPLVLIHGWSMHSGIWRQFAQKLGQHYQVICLDLPGHGYSEALEPYVLEQITEELMSAIPVQTFHVMGWSLGATVAMDMVSRFPERVTALMVLAGNPCFVQNNDWPGIKPEVLQSFADNLTLSCQTTLMRFLALQVNGLNNGKALLKQLKQAVLECDPPAVSVLQGGLEILRGADLTGALQLMNRPLVFILGDKDALVPVQSGEKVRQLKPTAEIHVLQNAGHLPFLTHQQQVIEIITHFCNEHVPG